MHTNEAGIDLFSMQCMGKSFELVSSAPFSRLNACTRWNDQAFSRLNAITLPVFPAEPFSRLNAGDLLAGNRFSAIFRDFPRFSAIFRDFPAFLRCFVIPPLRLGSHLGYLL